MPHPLTDRLDEVRRRLRRAGVIRGAALTALATVLGTVFASLADAFLRTDSTVVRLLLTLGAIPPGLYVAATFLLPPLRDRPTGVDLARRVERREPEWAGRLAAAASFVEDGPAAGSQDVQHRVVEQATQRLSAAPPADLGDPMRVMHAVAAALAVSLAALALVLTAPDAGETALLRLAFPFVAIEWPRTADLVLVAESGDLFDSAIRIGRGQTLRFTVRNLRGSVPDDLMLEWAAPGGRRREPVPIAEESVGDGESRLVGIGSIFAAEGPLHFRVVGGDHRDMPFVTAQVVPAPVFDEIRVKVEPPSYLDSPSVNLPKGVGNLEGVVGSSVTVAARTNKRLVSAELMIGDQPGPAASIGRDRRTVTAVFPLSEAGTQSYWFRLRDRLGFENPEPTRYDLRITADAIPTVTVTEPPEDIRATAEADLPVVVEASDDHGLTNVRIRFGRGDLRFEGESAAREDELQTIPLFDGPDRPTKGTYPLIWSLGPLRLTPGDRLTFRGEAGDAFDLGDLHLGASSPRTLTIVSAVEKREEILARQAALLADLLESRRDGERLRDAIDSLLSAAAADDLTPDDRTRLDRAEAGQRRLSSKLTAPGDGVETRASRAAAELRANRLDDPELVDRLDRISRELASLREDSLPATERDLIAARKAREGQDVAAALTETRRHVGATLEGLQALLGDLTAWQSRNDLAREVDELQATQRELAAETEAAAAETLGAGESQLSERQISDLERLSLRQTGLADRLAQLAGAVEQHASREPPPDDPAEPPDLALLAAAEHMRSGGLPSAARAAGESIRVNELGQAGRLQKQLLEDLDALRRTLTRAEPPAVDPVALRREADRLSDLAAEQREIVESLKKAEDRSEPLADDARERLTGEQSRLRDIAAEAARRLRDLGADNARDVLNDAVTSMDDAIERLARRDDPGARRDAEDAADRLERAQQEVHRSADRLSRRLSEERLESTSETVAALGERQRAINDEITRLDRLNVQAGHLSRSQLRTLLQTAESQQAVAGETTALAEKAEAAAVSFSLRSAADRMRSAAEALAAKQTGAVPQRHGRAAENHLDRITAALRPSDDGSQGTPAPAGTEPSSGSPDETVPRLAEFRLLKAIQEDLLDRTSEIDAARSAGDLAPALQDDLERLAAEQQAVTDLFLRLVTDPDAAAENE